MSRRRSSPFLPGPLRNSAANSSNRKQRHPRLPAVQVGAPARQTQSCPAGKSPSAARHERPARLEFRGHHARHGRRVSRESRRSRS